MEPTGGGPPAAERAGAGVQQHGVRGAARYCACCSYVCKNAGPTLLRVTAGSLWGLLRYAAFLLFFSALFVVMYIAITPLLYASANHEAALHDGILGVRVAEEVTNMGIDVANTAIDVVRPMQPLYNFVWFWVRKVSYFLARVFIIAIEEIVEIVLAPDNSNSDSAIPGCRSGDWTTFADIDLKVCLFSFIPIGDPEATGGSHPWPEYNGMSKIVQDLPALMEGSHPQSDRFWEVFLNYGGPQVPVHHPSEVLSAEEKRMHWSRYATDGSAFDGSSYAIPLRSWARTDADLKILKATVSEYFDAFPDLTVFLYYWDKVASALIYGLIDLLGIVADVLYDIAEFLAVLFLTLADHVFKAVYHGIKLVVAHAGPFISFIVTAGGEIFGIAMQFMWNSMACLFETSWTCASTKEVYGCCDPWQLHTREQCQSPSRINAAGNALSQFGKDTQRVCTPKDGVMSPDRGTVLLPPELSHGGATSHCRDDTHEDAVPMYPFYPFDPKNFFSAHVPPGAEQSVLHDGVESSVFEQLPDVWPFEDELDTPAYESSHHGLNTCDGVGPATTWTCDSKTESYLNPDFRHVSTTNGPFDTGQIPGNRFDSTERVCGSGSGSSNGVDVTDPKGVYTDSRATEPVTHCMQAHSRQTCIREYEDSGFEHLAGSSGRSIRSASLETTAVRPETDPHFVNATLSGGKCARGCGTESDTGSNAGTLDFWGYREVDMWNCSDSASQNGLSGVFADGADPTNSFVDEQSKVPVYVWNVLGCAEASEGAYGWKTAFCTDAAYIETQRGWCREALEDSRRGSVDTSQPGTHATPPRHKSQRCRTIALGSQEHTPTDEEVAAFMRAGCCPFRIRPPDSHNSTCASATTNPELSAYCMQEAVQVDHLERCYYPSCLQPISRPLAAPAKRSGVSQFSEDDLEHFYSLPACAQGNGCLRWQPGGAYSSGDSPDSQYTFAESNIIHLLQFCKPKMKTRFAFPQYCTCGSQSCMAPVLNYVVELVGFLEDWLSRWFKCGFYFDRYRCCGSGIEPQKPGTHSMLWRYWNFGPSDAVAEVELSKQLGLTATEVGSGAGETLQDSSRVRWNTEHITSGPAADLYATADEVLGGGIGGGQPCFLTSTMLGTSPVCKFELLEEECCGYCTAWVYKYTRISEVRKSRIDMLNRTYNRTPPVGHSHYNHGQNRGGGPCSQSPGGTLYTEQPGTHNPKSYRSAEDWAEVSAHDVGSLAKSDTSHAVKNAAEHFAAMDSHHWIVDSHGTQAHAGVRAGHSSLSDSRTKHAETSPLPPCDYADRQPWHDDDETEFVLDEDELHTMRHIMDIRDIHSGSLIPGFTDVPGLCSHDNPPNLLDADGSNMATCPISAIYAMRYRKQLNFARHASTFHGMPFSEPEEARRTKKGGFGFWRNMIYMRQFSANGYEWWDHLRDRGGSTRLPCGCTAAEYCPARKDRHPWVHGASLHSTGLHAAFNLMNPYHATDEFAHLYAMVDGLRLGNLQVGPPTADQKAKTMRDDLYQQDWRRAVSLPERSAVAFNFWKDTVLQQENSDDAAVNLLCQNTRVPLSIRAGVDFFIDPGTWNFQSKFCPNYQNQQMCDFYERNFCQYYREGPRYDESDLKNNPSGFQVEAGTENAGSRGALNPIEKRSYSGVCDGKQTLLYHSGANGAADFAETGCSDELYKYFSNVRKSYNRMAATQKAIDPDRHYRMSRWWRANIPLNSRRTTGGEWVSKLNAPLAAYLGIVWDEQLDEDWLRRIEAAIHKTRDDSDFWTAAEAKFGRYAYLSSFLEQQARLTSQWQSPMWNDMLAPAAWSHNNLHAGFSGQLSEQELTDPVYTLSHTAAWRGDGPSADPDTMLDPEHHYAEAYNVLMKPFLGDATDTSGINITNQTQLDRLLAHQKIQNKQRKSAAAQKLAQTIGDMNTVPPGCYVDLYMPWGASPKPARKTMGGSSAGLELKYNLDSRERAAVHMSLDQPTADRLAFAGRPTSKYSYVDQGLATQARWPSGGLGDGNREGSVYGEAFAPGLYDTRWHVADWSGVFGPRGPPDISGCTIKERSGGANGTLREYDPPEVSIGAGKGTCDIGQDAFDKLTQQQREILSHRSMYSDKNHRQRAVAGAGASLPMHMLTLTVMENDVESASGPTIEGVMDKTAAGTNFVTGAVNSDFDQDIRTSVTLRAGCWSAVARKWRSRGMQLLDPVALQQVYSVMSQTDEELASTLVKQHTAAIRKPLDTPAENQVRARSRMLLNIIARGVAMGMNIDGNGTRDGAVRNSSYVNLATFSARSAVHTNENDLVEGALSAQPGTDGDEVRQALWRRRDAINNNDIEAANQYIGWEPALATVSELFSQGTSNESSGEEFAGLTDMYLMNTQLTPDMVGSWARTPGVSAFEQLEPPASLPENGTWLKSSCLKFVGALGGVNDPVVSEGWSSGPHGWGYKQEQLNDPYWSGGSNVFSESTQALLDLAGENANASTPFDAIGLNSLLSELTGGAEVGSLGPTHLPGAFPRPGNHGEVLLTATEKDCYFCMEYRTPSPAAEACAHVDENTTCNAFAKSQQAIESAGVFEPTSTNCFATEGNESGTSVGNATILEENYDPTIGCLSMAWSTVWPRTDEGEEIPQCCDDCDAFARATREVAACFSDWDHCTDVIMTSSSDVLCGAFGPFMNGVVQALGVIESDLKAAHSWGIGPGATKVPPSRVCTTGSLLPNGKCPDQTAEPPSTYKGETIDEQMRSEEEEQNERTKQEIQDINRKYIQLAGKGTDGVKRSTWGKDWRDVGCWITDDQPTGDGAAGYRRDQAQYKMCKEHAKYSKLPTAPTTSTVPRGDVDPTSSGSLPKMDRSGDSSEQHLTTEETQFSANGFINNRGVMGPNAGAQRIVNYCNFCCDQQHQYCVNHNQPGDTCHLCNEAPAHTCTKPMLNPDLSEYMGYCYTQHAGDGPGVCYDMTDQEKHSKWGSKSSFDNMIRATQVTRMRHAVDQPDNVNLFDQSHTTLGETPSNFNTMEVLDTGVEQRDQLVFKLAHGTGHSEEPVKTFPKSDHARCNQRKTEALCLGPASPSCEWTTDLTCDAGEECRPGCRIAQREYETELVMHRDTNSVHYHSDRVRHPDEFFQIEPLTRADQAQLWDANGGFASNVGDSRNVDVSMYAAVRNTAARQTTPLTRCVPGVRHCNGMTADEYRLLSASSTILLNQTYGIYATACPACGRARCYCPLPDECGKSYDAPGCLRALILVDRTDKIAEWSNNVYPNCGAMLSAGYECNSDVSQVLSGATIGARLREYCAETCVYSKPPVEFSVVDAVYGKRETQRDAKRARLGGNNVFQTVNTPQLDMHGNPRFVKGYKHGFTTTGYVNPAVPGHINSASVYRSDAQHAALALNPSLTARSHSPTPGARFGMISGHLKSFTYTRSSSYKPLSPPPRIYMPKWAPPPGKKSALDAAVASFGHVACCVRNGVITANDWGPVTMWSLGNRLGISTFAELLALNRTQINERKQNLLQNPDARCDYPLFATFNSLSPGSYINKSHWVNAYDGTTKPLRASFVTGQDMPGVLSLQDLSSLISEFVSQTTPYPGTWPDDTVSIGGVVIPKSAFIRRSTKDELRFFSGDDNDNFNLTASFVRGAWLQHGDAEDDDWETVFADPVCVPGADIQDIQLKSKQLGATSEGYMDMCKVVSRLVEGTNVEELACGPSGLCLNYFFEGLGLNLMGGTRFTNEPCCDAYEYLASLEDFSTARKTCLAEATKMDNALEMVHAENYRHGTHDWLVFSGSQPDVDPWSLSLDPAGMYPPHDSDPRDGANFRTAVTGLDVTEFGAVDSFQYQTLPGSTLTGGAQPEQSVFSVVCRTIPSRATGAFAESVYSNFGRLVSMSKSGTTTHDSRSTATCGTVALNEGDQQYFSTHLLSSRGSSPSEPDNTVQVLLPFGMTLSNSGSGEILSSTLEECVSKCIETASGTTEKPCDCSTSALPGAISTGQRINLRKAALVADSFPDAERGEVLEHRVHDRNGEGWSSAYGGASVMSPGMLYTRSSTAIGVSSGFRSARLQEWGKAGVSDYAMLLQETPGPVCSAMTSTSHTQADCTAAPGCRPVYGKGACRYEIGAFDPHAAQPSWISANNETYACDVSGRECPPSVLLVADLAAETLAPYENGHELSNGDGGTDTCPYSSSITLPTDPNVASSSTLSTLSGWYLGVPLNSLDYSHADANIASTNWICVSERDPFSETPWGATHTAAALTAGSSKPTVRPTPKIIEHAAAEASRQPATGAIHGDYDPSKTDGMYCKKIKPFMSANELLQAHRSEASGYPSTDDLKGPDGQSQVVYGPGGLVLKSAPHKSVPNSAVPYFFAGLGNCVSGANLKPSHYDEQHMPNSIAGGLASGLPDWAVTYELLAGYCADSAVDHSELRSDAFVVSPEPKYLDAYRGQPRLVHMHAPGTMISNNTHARNNTVMYRQNMAFWDPSKPPLTSANENYNFHPNYAPDANTLLAWATFADQYNLGRTASDAHASGNCATVLARVKWIVTSNVPDAPVTRCPVALSHWTIACACNQDYFAKVTQRVEMLYTLRGYIEKATLRGGGCQQPVPAQKTANALKMCRSLWYPTTAPRRARSDRTAEGRALMPSAARWPDPSDLFDGGWANEGDVDVWPAALSFHVDMRNTDTATKHDSCIGAIKSKCSDEKKNALTTSDKHRRCQLCAAEVFLSHSACEGWRDDDVWLPPDVSSKLGLDHVIKSHDECYSTVGYANPRHGAVDNQCGVGLQRLGNIVRLLLAPVVPSQRVKNKYVCMASGHPHTDAHDYYRETCTTNQGCQYGTQALADYMYWPVTNTADRNHYNSPDKEFWCEGATVFAKGKPFDNPPKPGEYSHVCALFYGDQNKTDPANDYFAIRELRAGSQNSRGSSGYVDHPNAHHINLAQASARPAANSQNGWGSSTHNVNDPKDSEGFYSGYVGARVPLEGWKQDMKLHELAAIIVGTGWCRGTSIGVEPTTRDPLGNPAIFSMWNDMSWAKASSKTFGADTMNLKTWDKESPVYSDIIPGGPDEMDQHAGFYPYLQQSRGRRSLNEDGTCPAPQGETGFRCTDLHNCHTATTHAHANPTYASSPTGARCLERYKVHTGQSSMIYPLGSPEEDVLFGYNYPTREGVVNHFNIIENCTELSDCDPAHTVFTPEDRMHGLGSGHYSSAGAWTINGIGNYEATNVEWAYGFQHSTVFQTEGGDHNDAVLAARAPVQAAAMIGMSGNSLAPLWNRVVEYGVRELPEDGDAARFKPLIVTKGYPMNGTLESILRDQEPGVYKRGNVNPRDDQDAIEALMILLDVTAENAKIILQGSTNRPVDQDNGMEYQINWCSCRSQPDPQDNPSDWVHNPRSGTPWAQYLFNGFLTDPNFDSRVKAPGVPDEDTHRRKPVPNGTVSTELPLSGGVAIGTPEAQLCGPNSLSSDHCVCHGFSVYAHAAHREASPYGAYANRGVGFAGNVAPCSNAWWRAIPLRRPTAAYSVATNMIVTTDGHAELPQTTWTDPSGIRWSVDSGAQETTMLRQLPACNRSEPIPHQESSNQLIFGGNEALYSGDARTRFRYFSTNDQGDEVLQACCASIPCGGTQYAAVNEFGHPVMRSSCVEARADCCRAPKVACTHVAVDGGRRLLQSAADHAEDNEQRAEDDLQVGDEDQGAEADPPESSCDPPPMRRDPAKMRRYRADLDAHEARVEHAQLTRARLLTLQASRELARTNTQAAEQLAAMPTEGSALQRIAVDVRTGNVPDIESSECDELLRATAAGSSFAEPETLDLHHKLAWYACASLFMLNGLMSEGQPTPVGEHAFDVSLALPSATVGSAVHHVANGMASRALPTAEHLARQHRALEFEKLDAFCDTIVMRLELVGINSTDVVRGVPLAEKAAAKYGSPHRANWYPSKPQLPPLEPVGDPPRASPTVVEPRFFPLTSTSRVATPRRRAEEDLLEVHDVTGGSDVDDFVAAWRRVWPAAAQAPPAARSDSLPLASPTAWQDLIEETRQQYASTSAIPRPDRAVRQTAGEAIEDAQQTLGAPRNTRDSAVPRQASPTSAEAYDKAKESARTAAQWLRHQIDVSAEQAFPLERAATSGTVGIVERMFANSLTDAVAFAKDTQPIMQYMAAAAGNEAEHLTRAYPAIARMGEHIAASSAARQSDLERTVNPHTARTQSGRRAQENNASDADSSNTIFRPRRELPAVIESLHARLQSPDLGMALGVETVRHITRAFLHAADVKARTLDALGVRVLGEPWSDPTTLRQARHDSKTHTPLGRVVRGMLSRVFPDHYRYEDHDPSTADWTTYLLGNDTSWALVTKNLSDTQFMFVNTLLRHRPHARMGHRLARPEFAAHTVEKMTLLMQGVEGNGLMQKLHPKMQDLQEHAVKRHTRRHRRALIAENAPLNASSETRRRQMIEEFVSDSLRSSELISIAGDSTEGAGFGHLSLDAVAAQRLKKDCTIGDDKTEWSEKCDFEDAINPDTTNPDCIGCSSCMGCHARPPTCGARGRKICHTDADCVDARYCDSMYCNTNLLLSSSPAEKTTSAQLCTHGPHWVDSSCNVSATRDLDAALQILRDLEAHFWAPENSCENLKLVQKEEDCSKSCAGLTGPGKTDSLLKEGGGSSFFYTLNPQGIADIQQFGTEATSPEARNFYKYTARLRATVSWPTILAWACQEPGSHASSSVCSETQPPVSAAFASALRSVQRDCRGMGGSESDYTNKGHMEAVGGRKVPMSHHMAPLRINSDHCSGHAGFTCGCTRPINDPSNVMQTAPHEGESCVCGDFADQPADLQYELGFKDTWTYTLYNVALCWLYMEAEHMCFPAIPYEIGNYENVNWDIRSYLVENRVNYTCANQQNAKRDSQGYPLCDEQDLQVHLTCPTFSPLVYDDTAYVHLLPPSIFPKIYIKHAVYNRISNTLKAIHFGFRYIFMTVGGRGAKYFGVAWRVTFRFFLGGFVPAGNTIKFQTPNNWLVNLWTFPTCDPVDMEAHECTLLGDAINPPCPRCCRHGDRKDCSSCTVSQFVGHWENRSYGLTYRDNFRSPMIVDAECIPPHETTPTASMMICFWMQAGSVMWVSMVAIMLAGFVVAFRAPLKDMWKFVREAFDSLLFTFIPVDLTGIEQEEHLATVRAVSLEAALQAAGYTGEYSVAQMTRPLRRKVGVALASVKHAVVDTPVRAFDNAVKRALGVGDTE